MKKFLPIFLLFFFSFGYTQNENLHLLYHLPSTMEEISGIIKLQDSDLVWAINDSGTRNIVYGINSEGKIGKEVEIENAKNVDWEDLAKDNNGALFIGDFGNNDNDRKDLAIYLVKDFVHQEKKAKAKKIEFSFEDQDKFPPKKKNRNFGVEAFIYKNGNLYLFTKNRSKNMDGTVNLYQIPAKPGKYTAKKIGSFTTCDDKERCWITGATINAAGNKIFLLSHDTLWELSDFEGNAFFKGRTKTYDLGKKTQKEGVCFDKNDSLLICDEETKKEGRNLYHFTFPQDSP